MANDLAARAAALKAGVKEPEPLPGNVVVAFKGIYETAFAGECAVKVHAAIKAFAAENADRLKLERLLHDERTEIETAREYAGAELVNGNLIIRNAQWNALLAVIHAKGFEVTLTA
jgi:hypothetical protein